MDYLDWFIGCSLKDPNSSSALRRYEKDLDRILLKERTPRVVKEMKKLYKKIEAQKEKIRKKLLKQQDDKRTRTK